MLMLVIGYTGSKGVCSEFFFASFSTLPTCVLREETSTIWGDLIAKSEAVLIAFSINTGAMLGPDAIVPVRDPIEPCYRSPALSLTIFC
jgi:hypothetical protein